MRQMLFRASLPRYWSHRFPMVIDPGGVHWRHDDPIEPGEADRIIVAFTKWDEPIGENFSADDTRWEREFLPALLKRLPAMAPLTDVEGWAGLYEMTPDHNPVLGEHPALRGFVFANGFSGHGLMMSPATGKIVSEIVTHRREHDVRRRDLRARSLRARRARARRGDDLRGSGRRPANRRPA